MITATELQQAYVDLYTLLREYIWEFRTVEAIADLEIAVFKAFPDLPDVSKRLAILKQLVYFTDAFRLNGEFNQSFEDFQELLNNSTEIYVNLKRWQ